MGNTAGCPCISEDDVTDSGLNHTQSFTNYTSYNSLKLTMSNNEILYRSTSKSSELITKIDEWYNANGDNSKTATIESKVKEIKDGFKLFNERIEKQKKRNTSIKYFKSEISSAIKQGRNWIQEKPWIETYFNNEFKNFTNDLIDWIEDLEKQQGALTEYEEQIITKQILEKKIDLLKEEVKKMKKLPRPGTKTDL